MSVRPGTSVAELPSPSAFQTASWVVADAASTRPSSSTATAVGSPMLLCQAPSRCGDDGSRMSQSATQERRPSASSEPSWENASTGTDWSLALNTVSAVGLSPSDVRS